MDSDRTTYKAAYGTRGRVSRRGFCWLLHGAGRQEASGVRRILGIARACVFLCLFSYGVFVFFPTSKLGVVASAVLVMDV